MLRYLLVIVFGGLALSGCKIQKMTCTMDNAAETRCLGSVLEICNGLEWTVVSDCANSGLVCSDAKGDAVCTNEMTGGTMMSADAGMMSVCTPMEGRCNGMVLEQCAADGSSWETQTDCAAQGQTCNSDGVAQCVGQDCTRGTDPDFRCNSSGGSEICTTEYVDYVDCAASGAMCDPMTGRCYAPENCMNGEQRCTGELIEVCYNGGWRLREDCAFTDRTCQFMLEADCVGDRRCISGEKRCEQNRVETCSDGMFVVTDDCGSQNLQCKDEACEMVECMNGDVTCDVDVSSICEGGKWFTRDCAAEGKICNPRGRWTTTEPACVDECNPLWYRCNGNVVESCQNGMFTATETCANGCTMPTVVAALCN